MEPTSTSLDTGGILGSVGDVLRPPNRSVRQPDHHDRDEDIEPPSVAPDYPDRTVIRASRGPRPRRHRGPPDPPGADGAEFHRPRIADLLGRVRAGPGD